MLIIQEGMMRGRLLFVLWCSSILAVTGSKAALRCFSNYIRNISCVLDLGDSPRSNSSSLKFTGTEILSCPLVMMDQRYHCSCQVKKENDSFHFSDKYNISLCNESSCHVMIESFEPYVNIQVTPPSLAMQQINGSVNIIWEIYKSFYLKDVLIYELKLYDTQGNHKTLSSQDSTSILIERSDLKPETEYCIRARCMPGSKVGYQGIWSEWSKPTCWITEPEEELSEQENIIMFWAKYLSPVCLSAAVLFLVFISPTARMKIKTITHMPSPASFFQPLFQQHEGNLQEWLSLHHKCVLTYKPEEDLITSAVTVVPKFILKDPEEYRGFNNPPITHLEFPQHLTSYVGLPVVQVASPPISIEGEKDFPYTQLPFPVWGVDISQKEATAPPPEHFLDISKGDSGCSCEDLSQSPECSLPSSPVDESRLPHFCNDYCILNKTAEGIVPVLMSKQSSGKILSDSQQAEG